MKLVHSEIEKIFGAEAAEAERDERLMEYFYRSALYDQVTAESQLIIVVGFKGTGKSALMRMAYLEDARRGKVALWVTPDELGGEVYRDAGGREGESDQTRIMRGIRIWRRAIVELLLRRIAGPVNEDVRRRLREGEVRLTSLLSELAPQRRHAEIAVYIDDLDRAWSGQAADRTAVAALIYALRDLGRENRQLRMRLSLRYDVYWDVRQTDQGLDKIEGNVVRVMWTQHDIFVMLVKRVMTWKGKTADESELARWEQRRLAEELADVFEERIMGTEAWKGKQTYRVLLSLVRRRPRDMVKLATFAAREAAARRGERIGGLDIVKVIPEYSRGRVQDLVNEFRQIEPATERLILGMRPSTQKKEKWRYTTDELVVKLRGLVAQLGGRLEPVAAAHWLYKIGFLTARKEHEGGYIERRYYDQDPWLLTAAGDAGFGWEVHPAYREALAADPFKRWLGTEEVDSWAEV